MPPPIPEHVKRYTANPTRPARYRPGKAVQEDETSDEEEEEEEEQQKAVKPQRRPQARKPVPSKPVAQEEEEEDDEDGFVTEDEDEIDGGAPLGTSTARPTSQNTQTAQQQTSCHDHQTSISPRQSGVTTESEEESGSESESEEEEDSSSEDEAPQRRFQRPTFIKKTERNGSTSGQQNKDGNSDATSAPSMMSSHHTDDVAARRLAEAETLIKVTIERDVAARLAGKKSWDDDDDLPPEALVDDTDGIDPEAEHSAWRLREMHRLKRDREVMIAREKELEEIERRRNLSVAEREAEDQEYIAKQKEEKEEGRGKAGFLSKYHHKGAFFMDDETSERLAKRDLAGARFADDVADKSTLPEYMRIRDMTKLGKKGRTRYTDLKGQDTGRFGDDVKRWRGSGYENRNGPRTDDLRGVDERFLPDDDRGSRGPRASGANASAVGERRVRQRSRSRSGDDSRQRRRRSYSGSRSRSRSPPRKSRRHRSPSSYQEKDERRFVKA